MTIQRRKYLARSTVPIKRSPIKPSGKVKRFAKLRNPGYLAWLHEKPCVVSGGWPVDVHHVSGRKQPDLGSTVPLTHALHMELHTIGRMSFAIRYGVDLQAKAVELAAEFLQGVR